MFCATFIFQTHFRGNQLCWFHSSHIWLVWHIYFGNDDEVYRVRGGQRGSNRRCNQCGGDGCFSEPADTKWAGEKSDREGLWCDMCKSGWPHRAHNNYWSGREQAGADYLF